jgi:hypothetical protein
MSKKSIEFDGVLEPIKDLPGNAYVEFPWPIKEVFDKGRIKAHIWCDNVYYRGSLVKMTGINMLLLRKDVFAEVGKSHGDTVHCKVEEDTEERPVEIPQALAGLLAKGDGFQQKFDALSYTRRKEMAESISQAKRPDTVQKRLEKIAQDLA